MAIRSLNGSIFRITALDGQEDRRESDTWKRGNRCSKLGTISMLIVLF